MTFPYTNTACKWQPHRCKPSQTCMSFVFNFITLKAKVDQNCHYKGDSHHFIGKDCYEMTTKGEVGGGIALRKGDGSDSTGSECASNHDGPGCSHTAARYGIVVGKSWGTMTGTTSRREWQRHGCDKMWDRQRSWS
eukprot:FR738761.1.p1 GENE.FR738761.1~~FR738761.1.p1  ORF type:complete len:136 (+),score=7.51 FR738761.1:278-685(+)